MRWLGVVVSAVVVSACHSPAKVSEAPVPASAPAAGSCPATVRGHALHGWRVVQASGFTFCVPEDWNGQGSNWHSGDASIEWGFGQPPEQTVSVLVAVPAGTNPSMAAATAKDVRRFTEQIDGREAQMWDNRFDRSYYTGAVFARPGIYLVGHASDGSSANVELDIFRTVRFPPAS